jgi:long-chain acyl-CoA synthetase
VAPINTRYARREILHCLQDLDGVWICTDQANLESVESVRTNVEGVRGLIYIGDGPCPAGYLGLDELRSGDARLPIDDPDIADVAMIYFTGGTTGVSKGVMLTHGQILMAAQQSAAGIRSIDGEAVYLHVAPMFHMGDGVMCFVSAMTTCANAFIDRFEMKRFVETCNRDGVTWATMVPTMVRGLCLHIQESGQQIPTLKGIIYGGSPMPVSVLELAMQTFPAIEFVQGYGSTEALSITMLESHFHTLDDRGRRLLSSAGRPFRGVLISIQDDNGHELPVGAVGEICVRSNAVTKGYWRMPDMTKRAIKNNWFHTGDAGYLDDEGFLFLVDRVKDMIITGGENVYSREVEDVLLTHAAIDECAVVGMPDDKWGELVTAVLHCKADASVDVETLITLCRSQLAGYKVPKKFHFVSESLPRTAVGKIRKADVKALLQARPAS